MSAVKSVFHGAILTVAMRWTDRLIGLISLMVLARLLTPADFGVVAMASIVVGLIDVMLDLGVNIVLIQQKEVSKDDYNTAWTLRLIQTSLAGVVVFLCAPLAGTYFANSNVEDVLRVMAFGLFLAGLENIGIVSYQKNMEFGSDFRFFFFRRVAGFICTLGITLIWPSYWAMVSGALLGRTIGVLLSYTMHPFRPSISLASAAHIWSFSQWVLIRGIGSYLDTRSDKFLVGGKNSADITGTYTVADEIAALPSTELLAPLGRVMFPAFVNKRDDPQEMARSLSLAIGVQALVAIPACIGLAIVSVDVVRVVLGEQWAGAAIFIQILAITNLITSLTHSLWYAMLAYGHIRLIATLTWCQALFFLLSGVLVLQLGEATDFAILRFTSVLIGACLLMAVVLKKFKYLSPAQYFRSLMRPIAATIAMAAVLWPVQQYLNGVAVPVRLAVEILIGIALYAGTLAVLWIISGRPEGGEAYIKQNIMSSVRVSKH